MKTPLLALLLIACGPAPVQPLAPGPAPRASPPPPPIAAEPDPIPVSAGPPTVIFVSAGSAALSCSGHSLSLLEDGRALLVGQCELDGLRCGAVLFDPALNRWEVARSPGRPRVQHTATLLDDGRLLIAGGWATDDAPGAQLPLRSTEIFDPQRGDWTAGTDLLLGRAQHTATRQWDGTVFIAGGTINRRDQPPLPTDQTEVLSLDALSTEAFTRLAEARLGHTATAFARGLLLAGGRGLAGPAGSEVDLAPCTPPYALPTPPLMEHAAARLPEGVLVIGAGAAGLLRDLEPEGWSPTSSPLETPSRPVLLALRRGALFLVGGTTYAVVQESRRYEPELEAWAPGPALAGLYQDGAGLELADGRVLLVGMGAEISTGPL